MRILIFDTIAEQHVPDSLADALRLLGHQVEQTGKVWHGTAFPKKEESEAIEARVEEILADPPDVVFVMRACALVPHLVNRLRRAGVWTVVWFSDDPVLYTRQTKRVAPLYDLTLHTATAPVLQMYSTELGVDGWHFPFFTDQAHFPRLWELERCDLDLVFIGNTHSAVKQWRYGLIAGLEGRRAIYGSVPDDTAGIHAGVAQGDRELAEAAARGRWGLNINQRFADYEGSSWDFPELAGFGEFSMPSRVVQLGAVGVPCVTLSPLKSVADDLKRLYPPVRVVTNQEELASLVRRTGDGQLQELSEQMHEWFALHHTALARAAFLTWLLNESTVTRKQRRWSAVERDSAFLSFETPSPRRIAATRAVRRALNPRAWRPAPSGSS